jgi:hypothetical protein
MSLQQLRKLSDEDLSEGKRIIPADPAGVPWERRERETRQPLEADDWPEGTFHAS